MDERTPARVTPRGFAWPGGGVYAFDHGTSWGGRLYWAHEKPSLAFPAESEPSGDALHAAIPMGYTTMTLLERLAVVADGTSVRAWASAGAPAQPGPLQPYQLLVPPAGQAGFLLLGTTWPERFAVRDGERLSARVGGPIVVCRVISHTDWH